jgi:DNA-binding response OmpR family regulator
MRAKARLADPPKAGRVSGTDGEKMSSEAETPKSTRGKLVLLVEDDPSLRTSMKALFDAMELEVVVAVDYRAAVERIGERVPSLVVLDLNLPRDSGYDVIEHVRRAPGLYWVQILVISERRSPEDMAYAEEAGANAFLKKPFTNEQLAKYVKTLLGGNYSRPSVRALRRTDPPPSSGL